MVNSIQFTELVKSAYSFLETRFGFAYVGTEDTPRQIFVKYGKGELMVVVKYSRANYHIEVCIYNHVSKVTPGQYGWKYSVDLEWLMRRGNVGFDYNAIMPKQIAIEESVRQTAALLEQHGSSILLGQEWVSWGELSGYSQYVPPDLP